MLSYEFVILEVNGISCEFALDDIFWDEGDIENLLGDINNDGFINIVDIVTIVNIIIENGEYNTTADYNNDGIINIIDIIAIVNVIIR